MITNEVLESYPSVSLSQVKLGDYFIIHYMPDWCWTKQGLSAARVRIVTGAECYYDNIGMGIDAVLDENKKLDLHRLYYAGMENRQTYKLLVGLPSDFTPPLLPEVAKNYCAIHIPKEHEDTLYSLSSDPYYLKSLKYLRVPQDKTSRADSSRQISTGHHLTF